MAPRAKSRLLVRRPFTYLTSEGKRVAIARGAAVPDEVVRDPALRGRLIRCNYLYDPEHPESMGVPAHRADRVAAELEGQAPLHAVPDDTPDEQERDARRAARDAAVEKASRPWLEPHAPTSDAPAAWGPDIVPATPVAQEG